jgi:hypothetical protein
MSEEPRKQLTGFKKKLVALFVNMDPGEAVVPTLPKLLTGRNLWLFRAWLYLPLPGILLPYSVRGMLINPAISAIKFVLVIIGALTALTTLIVRYERRNRLHFPTPDDIQFLTMFLSIMFFGNLLIKLIENRHLDTGWPGHLLFSLSLIPLFLPHSIILNASNRRKQQQLPVKS